MRNGHVDQVVVRELKQDGTGSIRLHLTKTDQGFAGSAWGACKSFSTMEALDELRSLIQEPEVIQMQLNGELNIQ